MGKTGPMQLFIRPMCVCAFLVIANMAAFAADAPTSKNDPLDGLQFKGETGEQGKGDHHDHSTARVGASVRPLIVSGKKGTHIISVLLY